MPIDRAGAAEARPGTAGSAEGLGDDIDVEVQADRADGVEEEMVLAAGVDVGNADEEARSFADVPGLSSGCEAMRSAKPSGPPKVGSDGRPDDTEGAGATDAGLEADLVAEAPAVEASLLGVPDANALRKEGIDPIPFPEPLDLLLAPAARMAGVEFEGADVGDVGGIEELARAMSMASAAAFGIIRKPEADSLPALRADRLAKA